ncbi:AAA family ATPase [Desulfurivibrio sp. C05AmB]|uniref:AAA family ATPase n=1 Tax=Desulfurivibrio sp. C05AmB TaxID=3374371 RepID=UPI00376ECAC0
MIRRRRKKTASWADVDGHEQSPVLDKQVRLWVLRILAGLRGYRNFFELFRQSEEILLDLFGTSEPLDIDKNNLPRVVKTLQKHHRKAEAEAANPHSANPRLSNNLKLIGDLVGLSAIDRRILEFLVMLSNNAALANAAESLGDLSTQKFQHTLAVILDLPEAEIKASLSPSGTLEQSGLVRLDRANSNEMARKFELLSDNFADYMLTEEEDPRRILRDSVTTGKKTTLRLADFAHLGSDLEVLHGHLARCIADDKKGVNIFLHGPPGTGKTELARLMAEVIGHEMLEVASQDYDGNPINSIKRLQALRAAHNIFARRPVYLLFDEAEDVFNDGGFFSQSTADKHKAWINRLLEENQVPTIWLSNSAKLDPAFVRRFDVVLEIPVPPRRRREQLVEEICGDLLGPEARARIAEAESMAPAVLQRAMAVVNNLLRDNPQIKAAQVLENLINQTLVVQGHPPLSKGNAGRLPGHYDLRYLRADVDLAKITSGLAAERNGRLCLYGPPGTGKSAFGQWLAQKLDLPLHVHRASDILGPYVGETEQNMAQAFRKAEREQALLLIDEADSFLRDRREAQRSWEVTAVNEMLTQMEGFNGIFIASTNLLDTLDQASLRRFDLKIHFGYLTCKQAWPLFLSHCRSLGFSRPAVTLKKSLSIITTLTPGDFATVARKHKFHPLANPAELLAALQGECALKNDGRAKSIGFV